MGRLKNIAAAILLLMTGLLVACGPEASQEPGQGPHAAGRPIPALPTEEKVGGTVQGEWDTQVFTEAQGTSPSVSTLTGLAAISGQDVWAVGVRAQSVESRKALAMHWDGASWTSADVLVQDGALLRDVAATAQDDVWAIGLAGDSPLTLHYDGTQWEEVGVPTVQIDPRAVSATARDDVWIMGPSQSPTSYAPPPGECLTALHWDGREWDGVPVPGETGSGCMIDDLAALSKHDAWAVGTSDFAGIILHWNGKEWARSPIPFDGRFGSAMTYISGISAVAPDDVWAVGRFYGDDTVAHPLFMHWNGSEWTQVSADIEAAWDSPSSISAVARDDVWAAGPTGVWHWDGKTWSTMPNPIADEMVENPGYYGFSIIAALGSEVWAAGAVYDEPDTSAVVAHFVRE